MKITLLFYISIVFRSTLINNNCCNIRKIRKIGLESHVISVKYNVKFFIGVMNNYDFCLHF